MISLDEQYIKTELEIEKMQAAGHLNALVLEEIKKLIKPGVKTGDLDRTAEAIIRDNGGIPTFKGYPGPYPYPATLTISINEEMVHGIPSGRELVEGDIVSVDCGTTLDGYIGDSAFTKGVGEIGEEESRLIRVTRESLYKGIEQVLPGKHLGDVSEQSRSMWETLVTMFPGSTPAMVSADRCMNHPRYQTSAFQARV